MTMILTCLDQYKSDDPSVVVVSDTTLTPASPVRVEDEKEEEEEEEERGRRR